MRRALTIGAALMTALLVLLVMTTVAFAAPSPFTGVWWSEDVDNSYQ